MKLDVRTLPWIALRLAAAAIAAALLATCSIDAATFTSARDEEDCAAPGDEDASGAADCADPVCASTAECLAAACTDSVKNGDETDVDCGGRCPACRDGAACGVHGDCDSKLCGAATCVRRADCLEILEGGFSTGDGDYGIDPDETGGEPAFTVRCDMTTRGGGWTRFNWVKGPYPEKLDPLEQALSQCAPDDVLCRGRIPAAATPLELMVKDLGDGDFALWRFDTANTVSKAVLGALRDKTQGCVANVQPPWMPYLYQGTETFCGTGGEGGCDSFVYTDGTGCGTNYKGWYVQLEGDTGCHNAAFKIGMTHAGLETQGCEPVDVNYLDDGPSSSDDQIGELYYR